MAKQRSRFVPVLSVFLELPFVSERQKIVLNQTRLAVVHSGGIKRTGRRSSYSTKMRVSGGGQALVSGAPAITKAPKTNTASTTCAEGYPGSSRGCRKSDGVAKDRVTWLKKALGNKDPKQAKTFAKPVTMKFDRMIAPAEALNVEHPVQTELTEAEIKRIADHFYAQQLHTNEELREDGVKSDPVFASVHRQLVEAGAFSRAGTRWPMSACVCSYAAQGCSRRSGRTIARPAPWQSRVR
jgi:hypothetical protein